MPAALGGLRGSARIEREGFTAEGITADEWGEVGKSSSKPRARRPRAPRSQRVSGKDGGGQRSPLRRRSVSLAACLAVVVILAVCGLLARCVADRLRQNSAALTISQQVGDAHVYDWSRLVADGQLRSYDDDVYEAVWGIDVSSYQGDIDWERLRAAGVRFAMIRVGYRGYGSGTLVEDEYFARNAEAAQASGIDIGFYFFSQAVTEDEAREEADFVADRIAGYITSYPVVYDMENVTESDRIAGLTTTERTAITRAFCEEVKARGYYPMVYGNKTWLSSSIDMDALADYPVWFADYNDVPARDSGFQMLQYTEGGVLDGIESAGVDLDLCFFRKASGS